jgi:anti-sigma-K factor RskA
MNPERMDRRIHDYLDGRLSGDELAAFERRLQEDPELARTVARYRRLGELVAEEQPELSGAFFTRTRAAFEHTQRKRSRLLSWESLGLATAALLAVAIFLPPMLETPPAVVPAVVPVDDERAEFKEKSVKKDSRVEMEGVMAPSMQKLEADLYEDQSISGTPLPGGVIGPGEVRIVETDKAWAPVQSGLRRERSLAEEAAPAFHWVLIGKRTQPFDCARISIETGPDRHTIQLVSPPSDGQQVTWGCAVRVPLDDRQVIVLDPVTP